MPITARGETFTETLRSYWHKDCRYCERYQRACGRHPTADRPTIDTYLEVKWSVSRGRDTYGYNICTVVDTATGKRYRCSGGGYDLLGTSFGQWLSEVHSARLEAIADRAHNKYVMGVHGGYTTRDENKASDSLYGMSRYEHKHSLAQDTISVSVDGGCGLESMKRIAEAAGLTVRTLWNRAGHTTGFIVSETVESEVTAV